MERDPDKTLPIPNPDTTQRFAPVTPESSDTETREFHPDILQMIDLLNRETYVIMGPDGYIRTNLKVKRLDKVVQEHPGSDAPAAQWFVTLYDSANPDSAVDTFTMTLGEFAKESQRSVVEQ